MAEFRLGQEVVCIYGGSWVVVPTGEIERSKPLPGKGDVFKIAGFATTHFNRLGLILEGFLADLFDARCFRPVIERKTDISDLQKLLIPSGTKTKELV